MPSDVPRLAEVPPGAPTQVIVIARSFLRSVLIGSVATFGLALLVGLALEEDAVGLPPGWQVTDDLIRRLVSGSLLVGALGSALLLAGLWLALPFSTHRDLESAGSEVVPLRPQRELAEGRHERVANTGRFLTLLGGVLLLVVLLTMATSGSTGGLIGPLLWVLAGLAALTGLGVACWVTGLKRGWATPRAGYLNSVRLDAAQAAARDAAADQRTLPVADDPPLRRWARLADPARRLLTVAGILLAAAVVAVAVPAMMRQPCRGCHPLEYGSAVESLIDRGMGLGMLLLLAGTALLVTALLLGLVGGFGLRARYRVLAAGPDGDTNRPEEGRLTRLLGDPSPLLLSCLLLGVATTVAAWFTLATGALPAWLATGYGAQLVLLVIAEHERRTGNALFRQAWPLAEPE